MTQYVICPSCRKTVCMSEKTETCSECGQKLDIAAIRKSNLVIDPETEAREFASGKDYFVNTEFLSASEHFKKALNANGNSYLSLYFVMLCDIYLNETSPEYDVMAHAVDTVRESLSLMTRANVKINDRLNFITAVLTELKIIIVNRLRSHDKVYELDSVAYRRAEIAELQTLLQLFKIDGEMLMTYSPNVRAVLIEIADTAIAVCHKAVQTVAVGEELYSPTDFEYNRLVSLNGDFGFFAQSFDSDYDVKKYTPDFTQNMLLNDKVKSRFDKFDAAEKAYAKKHLINDVKAYASITEECVKALDFTYRSCFRSLCDSKFAKRKQLLEEGIVFLYRLLMPRVSLSDKKKPEYGVLKYYEVSDKCAMLTKFLADASAFGEFAADSLNGFYSALNDVAEMYMQPEFERYTKTVNKLKEIRGEEFKYYERFLFDAACAVSPSLYALVPFGERKGVRAKLVKFCKKVSEEFLMLRDYRIDEIDGSNVYRPILDIYNAVMKESEV